MGDHKIIKPHSFEDAKNHIQTFSKRTSSNLGLSKVSTSGGLFGLFDHVVTGEELNTITGEISNYLIRFNGLHTDFINEFGQVYKALESLDKEYIPAILSALKGAEMASNQAKTANDNNKKSIEELEKITSVLENHKENLDKLKHLGSIDEIWTSSKTLEKGMEHFKNKSEEMKKQFSKLEGSLKALQRFADGILNYEHLEEVDEMWEKINDSEEKFLDIDIEVEDLDSKISSNLRQIENLENRIKPILQYEHLSEIDVIWSDLEIQKKYLTDLQNMIDKCKQDIEIIMPDILDFNNFKKELGKQEHLGQIDDIWNEVVEGKKAIEQVCDTASKNEESILNLNNSLEREEKVIQSIADRVNGAEGAINSQQTNIDNIGKQISELITHQSAVTDDLKRELAEEKNAHAMDVSSLSKRIKIAYCIGGGAVLLGTIELALLIMRIL